MDEDIGGATGSSAGIAHDTKELELLTIKDILETLPAGTFTRAQKRKRSDVLDAVSGLGEDAWTRLRAATREKEHKRRRTQTELLQPPTLGPNPDETQFMTIASEDDIKKSVREYIRLTNNKALKREVCVCCARLRWDVEGKRRDLSEVPNVHCLVPHHPHPAQVLTRGMLLVHEKVRGDAGRESGFFCEECWKELKKDSLPKYSLCNNLWIGVHPPLLPALRMSEQMLLALRYPKCVVCKMYPKDNFVDDPRKIQRGIRGNVTCYDLDPAQIQDMVDGNKIPRKPAILASLIIISLIGVGDVPHDWLQHTFGVRRPVLRMWTAFLCKFNPAYRRMQVCEETMAMLPVDGVPDELMMTLRYESDAGTVDREAPNYVTTHEDEVASLEGEPAEEAQPALEEVEINGDVYVYHARDHQHPDVVPLHSLGVCDNEMADLSSHDILMAALADGRAHGDERPYAVRHGWQAMSDFRHPKEGRRPEPEDFNPISILFPSLFPYGVGGIDDDREKPLKFLEHIQWLLSYYDRQFAHHYSFMFVVFGILQKRQILASARVEMNRHDFRRHSQLLESITAADVAQAERDEKEQKPIRNEKMKVLKRILRSTAGRVLGSNKSRAQYRGNIWGTTLVKGPPSLWVTLNFDDLNNPIAQIVAGEGINMDRFNCLLGPSKDRRAMNVARDPVSAAESFYLWIDIIMRALFGVYRTDFKVKTRRGVASDIAAYFGVVEAQGRGTLHLHMLMWLDHTPTYRRIHDLLQDPEFRERVKIYIQHNICAYVDGLDTKQDILAMEKDKEIGYNRPPDPDSPDFWAQMKRMEKRAARASQVHTCKETTCLKGRGGRPPCNRRAPFEVAEEAWISADGHWGPKRVFPYFNNWHPTVLPVTPANHDIKLVTNGSDTRNLTWYFAGYETKGQKQSHNASALLAPTLRKHQDRPEFRADIMNRSRLMVISCQNTLNKQQEMSGPQVAAHLMGWGDCVKSHQYASIYTSALFGALVRHFPGLDGNSREAYYHVSDVSWDRGEGERPDVTNDSVRFTCDAEGRLTVQPNQVDDYVWRGDAFGDYSYFAYQIDTYERTGGVPKESEATAGEPVAEGSRYGRPRNTCVRYKTMHPKHKSAVRVVRSSGHNTLPSIVGPYPPRRDDPEIFPYFCAAMLAMHKPFRAFGDLKKPEETWQEAFDAFMSTAAVETKNCIDSVQYYYECSDAADHKRAEERTRKGGEIDEVGNADAVWMTLDEDVADDEDAVYVTNASSKGPEDVQELLKAQEYDREAMHGSAAVEVGKMAGIFPEDEECTSRRGPPLNFAPIRTACGDDYTMLREWQNVLEMQKWRMLGAEGEQSVTGTMASGHNQAADVLTESEARKRTRDAQPTVEFMSPDFLGAYEELMQPANPDELFPEQRRAYDIVASHFEATVSGENPDQLLMHVPGEGGVGKSKVISTITDLFVSRGQGHLLAKASYTGIASSLIGGSTLSTLFCMPKKGSMPKSDKALKDLQLRWRGKTYLIIDEISMVPRKFLSIIDYLLKKVKSEEAGVSVTRPFGGINVVILGDFHQFPPVARGLKASLFCPAESGAEDVRSSLGRKLYEQFVVVMKLTKQVRVKDPEWLDVLRHVRQGACTEDHIDIIRDLILTNQVRDGPISDPEIWKDAVLVTPRHGVRIKWNSAAVRRHCVETEQRLFVCHARDTVAGRPCNWDEKYAILHLNSRAEGEIVDCRAGLPHKVEVAIGAKVMVTLNVNTEMDIANGARGYIHDILFDEEEGSHAGEREVEVERQPACILIKLERSKSVKLRGLPEGVIPVAPSEKKFTIYVDGQKRTVTRKQFPITLAYALTDYRSQGQSIPILIIDIAPPPVGGLSGFNAYVALSRGISRDKIRILRDFKDNILTEHPSELLELEDNRLDALDKETRDLWGRCAGDINQFMLGVNVGRVVFSPSVQDMEDILQEEAKVAKEKAKSRQVLQHPCIKFQVSDTSWDRKKKARKG